MAQNYIIDSQYLKDIADAIRKKAKTNQKYTVKEMANAILGLNTPETAEIEDTLNLRLHGKMKFNFTDEVGAGLYFHIPYIKVIDRTISQTGAFLHLVPGAVFPKSYIYEAIGINYDNTIYNTSGTHYTFTVCGLNSGAFGIQAPASSTTRNLRGDSDIVWLIEGTDQTGVVSTAIPFEQVFTIRTNSKSGTAGSNGIMMFGYPNNAFTDVQSAYYEWRPMGPLNYHLHKFNVWDSTRTELLYSFIPYEDGGDKGMYDTVNEIFYPCSNNDYFEIGEDLVPA